RDDKATTTIEKTSISASIYAGLKFGCADTCQLHALFAPQDKRREIDDGIGIVGHFAGSTQNRPPDCGIRRTGRRPVQAWPAILQNLSPPGASSFAWRCGQVLSAEPPS